MNIGDILHTVAEREAAPIGAVIRLVEHSHAGDRWTKTGPNEWTNGLGGVRNNRVGAGWCPDSDPTGYEVIEWPTPTTPEFIYTAAERATAPIGAVIRPSDSRHTLTKVGLNLWRHSNGSERPDTWPNGWYEDSSPGDQYYYRVVTWPVDPNGPQVSDVADYAALLALPVGSLFCAASQPAVRWEVIDGTHAIRQGDPARVQVNLSVFEGPANAGHLRSAEQGAREVTHLGVGDLIETREQFDALPVGTTIRGTANVTRTKVDDGSWLAGGGRPARTSDRLRLGYHRVVSIPEPAPVAVTPVLPAVGETVATVEQFDAMPVGTTVSSGGNQWTKNSAGQWCIHRGGSPDPDGIPATSMTVPGYNTVVSYPAPVLPEVGEFFTSTEQFTAAPVGTQVRNVRGADASKLAPNSWGQGGVHHWEEDVLNVANWWRLVSVPTDPAPVRPDGWTVGAMVTTQGQLDTLPVGARIRWLNGAGTIFRTKREDGSWVRDGNVIRATNLAMDHGWEVVSLPDVEPVTVPFVVGMEVDTVEQYRALPIHTVVRENPSGQSHYPITKRDADTWQDQSTTWSNESISDGSTRTIVALPSVSLTTEDTITVAEHHRIMAQQVQHALDARNDEVLTTLRDAWDGVDFNERQINAVLDELGLGVISVEPETEDITVTVNVRGRSTLDSTDLERLVEGDYSASMDSTEVTWDIDGIDFGPFTVEVDDCACSNVDRDMIEGRLRDGNVSFDSFDFDRECSNC